METCATERETIDVDISRPRYPQNTFFGRFRHFWEVANPINSLASDAVLQEAKSTVLGYRAGTVKVLAPVQNEKSAFIEESNSDEAVKQVTKYVSEADLWRAKSLYDSAFHPDTGEKVFVLGRMACQVPTNTLIVGCMLHFRHTLPQMLFWQWINQTQNGFVNYCNRNASVEVSNQELLRCYVTAVGSSFMFSIGLTRLVRKGTLLERCIPIISAVGAQGFNVPLMRQKELMHGVTLYEDELLTQNVGAGTTHSNVCEMGERVTSGVRSESHLVNKALVSVTKHQSVTKNPPTMEVKSQTAAVYACALTFGVRAAMAIGSAIPCQFAMQKVFEPTVLRRAPILQLPLIMGTYSAFLVFACPMGLALWPQAQKITSCEVDRKVLEDIYAGRTIPREFYYNKGL